jgi:hypothetical protein
MTKQNENFNRAFRFLPKIDHKEEEKFKNLFPNRQNLHSVKQTYSKYLNNSKKEIFQPNYIDLTLAATNILKTNNNNFEISSSYFGSDLDRFEYEKSKSFYIGDSKKL